MDVEEFMQMIQIESMQNVHIILMDCIMVRKMFTFRVESF